MPKRFFLVGAVTLSLVSCKKDPVIENFDGYGAEPAAGSCTVYDESSYAFSKQVNGLNSDESLDFFTGNSLFNHNWVQAPSSTTVRDGLGPLFNSNSCSGCHFRDGRGLPLTSEGFLFRLGTPSSTTLTGSIADVIYGGQLQDHHISTVQEEGAMDIHYTEVVGYYADGTSYSLRVPSYSISGQYYGPLTGTVLFSPRVAQQMIGLGLLEQIPESRIVSYADPYDADHDGISGKPNYVYDVLTSGYSLGRFGWKANVPSIPQQVAGAFNGDIGITSSLFPNENYTVNQPACSGQPTGGSPEISDDDLASVVLYSRTLAVPAQRNPMDADVMAGKNLFKQLNCNACHIPRHVTGVGGTINALKNITIRPYTDMLLHDMGDDLADNLPDYRASGREWRTSPLWGLGLIQTVNGHTYLLHDGRARSIEEAVLWHGGEAEKSKNQFKALPKVQRSQLLKFLESL